MSENITLENFEQSHVDDSNLKTPEEIKKRIEEINQEKIKKEEELEKIENNLKEIDKGDKDYQTNLENEKKNIEKQIKEKKAQLGTQNDDVQSMTGQDNDQNKLNDKLNDELNKLEKQKSEIGEKLDKYSGLETNQMNSSAEKEKFKERIKNLQQRQLELQSTSAVQPEQKPANPQTAQQQAQQPVPQAQPEQPASTEVEKSEQGQEKVETVVTQPVSAQTAPKTPTPESALQTEPQTSKEQQPATEPEQTDVSTDVAPAKPVLNIEPEKSEQEQEKAEPKKTQAEVVAQQPEQTNTSAEATIADAAPAQPAPKTPTPESALQTEPQTSKEQQPATAPEQTDVSTDVAPEQPILNAEPVAQQQAQPQSATADASKIAAGTAEAAKAEQTASTDTAKEQEQKEEAERKQKEEAEKRQKEEEEKKGQPKEQPAASASKIAAGTTEAAKAEQQAPAQPEQPASTEVEKSEQGQEKAVEQQPIERQIYINEIINRLEKNIWNNKLTHGLAILDDNEKEEILISALGEWYRTHLTNPEDFDKTEVINPGNEEGIGRVENLSMKDIIELTVKEKFNFFEEVFKEQPKNKQTILMQILMQAAKDSKYYTKYYAESNDVVELLTPIQSGLKDEDGNTALSIALQEENSNDLNIAFLFKNNKEREATTKVENLKNIDAKIKERLKKVVNNENITYKFKIQDQQVEDFIEEISSSKSPAETLQQQTNTTKTNDQKENQETNQPLEYTTEEKKEAKVIFDDEIENAYIEELVNRLKNGQWGKVKLNINAEKININKEISKLPEKTQKYLLTKALKKIYNGNSEDKNELQYQLSLGNNFNIDNDIINRLIETTVNKNFEREYKEELFAEKQPKQRKQRTITLTDITNDIVNTFKIEQYKAEQIQQQAKELTGFENKVQKRMDDITELAKQGKAKDFKNTYEENLKDPVKHEVDVAALDRLKNGSKEQKKIYRKVNPFLFIHGTYAKIKLDQRDYNNRYKTLDKVLENNKLQNVKKFIETWQKYQNNPEFIEGIKSTCDQNEKLQRKALNAILPATKNVVIEDTKVLNEAFKEIDNNNSYSITKPTEDDMAYFKFLYARANKETRNDFLKSEEFTTKFKELSQEKKEIFLYFLEDIGDIGEKKKIDILGLKTEQNEESKDPAHSDEDIFKDWYENGISVNMEKDSNLKENSKEEQLAPFYVFNQDGVSIKNDENLLAKETFKLQDSFLGLVCAKDKKAFVLSNWMRAKQTRDKNGNKIENKDEQITSTQVKAQRAAEKAAKEAIKEAGGDFNAIKKKTMPLLKNTKITFTFHGKPIPLSQAVRVCMELERRNRERELNMGIIRGEEIPEKTLMERISERLKLNVKEGYFSDEEKKLVQEAISAQIIATQAFVETFKGNNKALANKLENGREQVMQNQQTADNVRGTSQIINNGKESGATMNMNKNSLLNQKTQDQNQTQYTPSNSSGPEADSSIKSSTELEAESQPNIQQGNGQNLKDSAIIGGLTNGFEQAAKEQSTQLSNNQKSHTKEKSKGYCIL